MWLSRISRVIIVNANKKFGRDVKPYTSGLKQSVIFGDQDDA